MSKAYEKTNNYSEHFCMVFGPQLIKTYLTLIKVQLIKLMPSSEVHQGSELTKL